MSEERITIDKPEDNSKKSKARVEAGKRLAEYNKAMRKRKELGETTSSEEPVRLESNCENDVGTVSNDSTKIMIFVGLAGLAYYLYTTNNRKEEEVKRKSDVQQQEREQPIVQDNNVNSVIGLRSFKN